MINSARNKWARQTQLRLSDISMSMDSCAAIDGANMSRSDRERCQTLAREMMNILSRY